MKLNVKRLRDGAELPVYKTEGAAGADLRACIDAPVTVPPSCTAVIPTGIAVGIPEGYAGMVYARSGLSIKSGIALANGVGVIDSDYRGEVCVGLINLGKDEYTVHNGDRIAQLVITPVERCEPVWADELDQTQRGEGGFGSTGR